MSRSFLDDFDDDELDSDDNWATSNTPASGGDDDQFDQLRRRSARVGSAFDDMAEEDVDQDAMPTSSQREPSPQPAMASSGRFTASQRLVLILLMLLNVLVIGWGVLLLMQWL